MYRYGRVAPQDWQNFPEATFEDGNMCDWIGPLPKGQVLRLRFGAKTMLGHVLVCFALVGVGCCRLEPSIFCHCTRVTCNAFVVIIPNSVYMQVSIVSKVA